MFYYTYRKFSFNSVKLIGKGISTKMGDFANFLQKNSTFLKVKKLEEEKMLRSLAKLNLL